MHQIPSFNRNAYFKWRMIMYSRRSLFPVLIILLAWPLLAAIDEPVRVVLLISISILKGKSKPGEMCEGWEKSQRESGLAGVGREVPQAKGRDLFPFHPSQS
jgi:hypothetical protein